MQKKRKKTASIFFTMPNLLCFLINSDYIYIYIYYKVIIKPNKTFPWKEISNTVFCIRLLHCALFPHTHSRLKKGEIVKLDYYSGISRFFLFAICNGKSQDSIPRNFCLH